MQKLFLAAAVAMFTLGLGLVSRQARAADGKGGGHAMTGVLIDNTCGAKQKDEAAAMKHAVKCSLKEACAASGYQLIVGDKHYQLTDKGNGKAKAYLEKAASNHVTIQGAMDGDKMDAASIKPAAGGHDHGSHSM